jgi:hypothetical protein
LTHYFRGSLAWFVESQDLIYSLPLKEHLIHESNDNTGNDNIGSDNIGSDN